MEIHKHKYALGQQRTHTHTHACTCRTASPLIAFSIFIIFPVWEAMTDVAEEVCDEWCCQEESSALRIISRQFLSTCVCVGRCVFSRPALLWPTTDLLSHFSTLKSQWRQSTDNRIELKLRQVWVKQSKWSAAGLIKCCVNTHYYYTVNSYLNTLRYAHQSSVWCLSATTVI